MGGGQGGGRGGYGGGGGGGGGYGGGGRGGFGGRGARKNALGFHGSLEADPRVEQELFGEATCTTSGINFDRYDSIPVEATWTQGEPPAPVTTFELATLGQGLIDNCVRAGYTKPTPVQKYSIPIGTEGLDLMACAQTGSGKTAGFLFPVIAQMLKNRAAPTPER